MFYSIEYEGKEGKFQTVNKRSAEREKYELKQKGIDAKIEQVRNNAKVTHKKF